MPGTVIAKHMNLGYAGKITKDADVIVFNRMVNHDSADIPFGAPVCLLGENEYEGWYGASTLEKFAGIAVAIVKQATTYAEPVFSYKAHQRCDVLFRGSAAVICAKGTPTAGGKVYVRILENEEYPSAKVGDWEAEPDITPEVPEVLEPPTPAVPAVIRTIEITNARWETGYTDANHITEVTLIRRKK